MMNQNFFGVRNFVLQTEDFGGIIKRMPSETVEDYLKAIYRLGGGEEVSPGDVAESLGVTPATATLMMQRLDREGEFVEYLRRGCVRLTAKGRREALRVLRRHRLIELFLVEVLGMGWEEVHGEAERLEHAFSDRLVERVAEMLGEPKYDPHGRPIPDARGRVPEERRVPLSGVGVGEYVVVSYGEMAEGVREVWVGRGLRLGGRVRVVGVDEVGDVVEVELGGERWAMGGRVAEGVMVRAVEG